MVLDAPVDPGFDLVTFAREQSVAVEGALQAYGVEATKRDWHGVDVLEEIAAQSEIAPIPSQDGERPARASDVLYGSVEAVVEPTSGWRSLSRALGAAQAGNGAPLVQLSDRYFGRAGGGRPALVVEAQLAVLCADLERPASLAAFRAAQPELALASPHFGVANYLSLLPCLYWPAPARPRDAIRAAGAPILVVTSTRDPLTPHLWGERMAAALGAQRADVEGDGHTSYGRDDATARKIDEFLLAAP
jgi:pimeloyl-ACP methyl ester carboxylesterase